MTACFRAVLEMSFYASVLIAVILPLRLLLKKAPKSLCLLLWAAVGLRLILPFSFESAFALIPNADAFLPGASEASVSRDADDESRESLVTTAIFETAPLMGESETAIVSGADKTAPAEPSPERPFDQGQSHKATLSPWTVCAMLWAAVAFGLLLYEFFTLHTLRDRLKSAIPCRANVFLTNRVSSPFVFGFLSPRIYLPYPIEQAEIPYILLHEQTHIRRGDHLTKPLAFVILAIHWFNPLVWIAYRLFCRDIELSCDESVIAQNGNRADYSRSLLKYAAPAARIPFAPPGFGEKDVKTRVKNVLSYRRPTAIIVILLLLLCLSVVLLFTMNRPLSDGTDRETQPQSEHTMQDAQGRDETSMPVSPSPSHPSRAVSDFMPQKAERLLFCDPLGQGKDHYLLAYADSDGNPLYYTAKAHQTETGFFYSPFTAALPAGYENAFGFLPLYVINREESDVSELVIRFQTLEGVRYQICTMTEITLPDGEQADMWTSTVLLRTDFLSLYQPKETTVTALSEESWRFVLNYDGILTDSAYQLLFDMVSGQSDTDDYNLFTIDRYTIKRTEDYALSFDFHVSESRHDTVGVGDYQTVLYDYVEPMLEGLHEFKRVDFNAFGEFSDREEAWLVAEWLLSRYHWRSPSFGEAKENEISNFLCRYYGDGKLPMEEFKKLAKEKFGIENPTEPDYFQVEQNGELFVYSGDLGGLISYEIKNVQTVGDSTEVSVQFYADINRIVNSHLVTYVFGEGGVWREMRVEEESPYPPLGLS